MHHIKGGDGKDVSILGGNDTHFRKLLKKPPDCHFLRGVRFREFPFSATRLLRHSLWEDWWQEIPRAWHGFTESKIEVPFISEIKRTSGADGVLRVCIPNIGPNTAQTNDSGGVGIDHLATFTGSSWMAHPERYCSPASSWRPASEGNPYLYIDA
jgi:hypothetical protein